MVKVPPSVARAAKGAEKAVRRAGGSAMPTIRRTVQKAATSEGRASIAAAAKKRTQDFANNETIKGLTDQAQALRTPEGRSLANARLRKAASEGYDQAKALRTSDGRKALRKTVQEGAGQVATKVKSNSHVQKLMESAKAKFEALKTSRPAKMAEGVASRVKDEVGNIGRQVKNVGNGAAEQVSTARRNFRKHRSENQSFGKAMLNTFADGAESLAQKDITGMLKSAGSTASYTNPLGLGKKAIQVGAGVKTKMPFMERVTSTVSDGIGKALTGSARVARRFGQPTVKSTPNS